MEEHYLYLIIIVIVVIDQFNNVKSLDLLHGPLLAPADPPDVGSALADDKLVELFEDGNLDLVSTFSHLLGKIG